MKASGAEPNVVGGKRDTDCSARSLEIPLVPARALVLRPFRSSAHHAARTLYAREIYGDLWRGSARSLVNFEKLPHPNPEEISPEKVTARSRELSENLPRFFLN